MCRHVNFATPLPGVTGPSSQVLDDASSQMPHHATIVTPDNKHEARTDQDMLGAPVVKLGGLLMFLS